MLYWRKLLSPKDDATRYYRPFNLLNYVFMIYFLLMPLKSTEVSMCDLLCRCWFFSHHCKLTEKTIIVFKIVSKMMKWAHKLKVYFKTILTLNKKVHNDILIWITSLAEMKCIYYLNIGRLPANSLQIQTKLGIVNPQENIRWQQVHKWNSNFFTWSRTERNHSPTDDAIRKYSHFNTLR